MFHLLGVHSCLQPSERFVYFYLPVGLFSLDGCNFRVDTSKPPFEKCTLVREKKHLPIIYNNFRKCAFYFLSAMSFIVVVCAINLIRYFITLPKLLKHIYLFFWNKITLYQLSNILFHKYINFIDISNILDLVVRHNYRYGYQINGFLDTLFRGQFHFDMYNKHHIFYWDTSSFHPVSLYKMEVCHIGVCQPVFQTLVHIDRYIQMSVLSKFCLRDKFPFPSFALWNKLCNVDHQRLCLLLFHPADQCTANTC